MNNSPLELEYLEMKSIIIYNFLRKYNILEKKIKECFQSEFSICDDIDKVSKLHFYYGSKLSTYLDYSNEKIIVRNVKFDKNRKFSDFSLKQLIKINEEIEIMSFLNEKNIESFNNRRIMYKLSDSLIQIIEMRNVLSHELENCRFSNKHVIEILSSGELKKLDYKFLKNVDLSRIDDISKNVISNYAYMIKIEEKLFEKTD